MNQPDRLTAAAGLSKFNPNLQGGSPSLNCWWSSRFWRPCCCPPWRRPKHGRRSTTTTIVTAVDNGGKTTQATNEFGIIYGLPSISASVSPNPVGLNQVVTITATVLGKSYPVSAGGVTVDVSAIAGTSPGTTLLTLNLSATPNNYTNTYSVLNTTAYERRL